MGKTALDAVLAYSGTSGMYNDALWGMNDYGNKAMRTFARPRIVANAISGDVRDTRFGIVEPNLTEGTNRTKVGVVEIDDPNLLYHTELGRWKGSNG